MTVSIATMSGEDSGITVVTDNGWTKCESCKVGIDTGKYDKEGKRVIEQVDGFRWTKTVGKTETSPGTEYEVYLPASKTPTEHGVTV